jgi:hypothetical protein
MNNVCTYVGTYVCACVRMYVCMYVCITIHSDSLRYLNFDPYMFSGLFIHRELQLCFMHNYAFIIIIIGKDTISFMHGIYTYIP